MITETFFGHDMLCDCNLYIYVYVTYMFTVFWTFLLVVTAFQKNLIVLYLFWDWKTVAPFICMRKRPIIVGEPCQQFTGFAENIPWWDSQAEMQQFLLPGLFMFSSTITNYLLYPIVSKLSNFLKCNLFGQNTNDTDAPLYWKSWVLLIPFKTMVCNNKSYVAAWLSSSSWSDPSSNHPSW